MPDESAMRNLSYDAVETEVKDIWAKALRVSDISVREDFFQLGGDSLAAMVCISRMKSAFGVEFSIEDFFGDEATVSSFAASIVESKPRS